VGEEGGDLRWQNEKRRMILNHYLNGNLQQQEIVHFCAFNHCMDEAETRRNFEVLVTWALCPRKPPKYSRGRWTNYDKSVMWAGLLASHHGLLEAVICKYTGKAQTPPVKSLVALPADGDDSDDGPDTWGQVLQDVLSEVSADASHAMKDEAPVEPVGNDDGDGPSSRVQSFDWVEFNRRQKAEASKWVQTEPCPRLAIMQQIVRHFLAVMHHFLKISGDDWDAEQIKLRSQGQKPSYKISDCASSKAVEKCFDRLIASLNFLPQALPDRHHTRFHRNLFFRTVAKGACALHQLVRLMHTSFPYKLFTVLGHGQGWQALSEEPECLFDELTSSFAKHFARPENMPDAMVTLEALASCSSIDVAQIECRHATNRDFTMLRGRGWTPSLDVVSAKFACGTFKPLDFGSRQRKRVKKKVEKKVTRPGGAWRAFVSAKLGGGRAWRDPSTMKELSAEYRALSGEERAHFVELGMLATVAGQHGYKPFGTRFKKKESSVKTITPGTVTRTGAIALDDGREDLALVHAAGQPFADAFADFDS